MVVYGLPGLLLLNDQIKEQAIKLKNQKLVQWAKNSIMKIKVLAKIISMEKRWNYFINGRQLSRHSFTN